MTFDFSAVWTKMQAMRQGTIAALPNLVVAMIVFVLFYFVAKGVKGG